MLRAPSIIILALSLGVITDANASPYDREIEAAAGRVGLSAHLVHAVVKTESAYRKGARSRAGAVGLMQLMPATAKRFGVTNRKDPAQSLRGGTVYLSWLLRRYNGNLQFALAGYNAGEGAVDKYNGIPPYRETRNYVVKVMKELRRRQAAYPNKVSNPNIVRIVKKQEATPGKQSTTETLEAASMVRVTSLQKGVKPSDGLVAKQEVGTTQGGVQKNSPAADEYTVRYANLTTTRTNVSSVGFSFFEVN
ncbi:MAG: lytic transglycosylase domain-containing protein [Gammaproteobacteria bacterium]|nr:lytic transglycosylase domain-containing protein [Gammaproteobacteria bacterium]